MIDPEYIKGVIGLCRTMPTQEAIYDILDIVRMLNDNMAELICTQADMGATLSCLIRGVKPE